MSYYAVIDTNILVSANLKKDSLPGLVIELTLRGEIKPILTEEIFNEYITVLSREKFGFDEKKIITLLSSIRLKSTFFEVKESDCDFIDYNDKKFYDLYYSFKSNCEVYLITGNKKHFPNEKNIVTPREFFEIIINM